MTAPGEPGRPKKGHETVEQMMMEAQILNLFDRNYTHREIASVVGLHHTTVGETIRRINRRTLADFDRTTARALKLRQLHRIQESIMPFVVDPHGRTDFMPDPKLTAQLLRAIKAERELMGADAPTRVEISVGEDGEGEQVGAEEAANVQRFMELADRIMTSGYGSGRIIDADVVEDDDEDDAGDRGPLDRVRGPGSDAPQLEAGPPVDGAVDATATVEMDESDDGLDDDPIGVWRDGIFYPAESESGPDNDDQT